MTTYLLTYYHDDFRRFPVSTAVSAPSMADGELPGCFVAYVRDVIANDHFTACHVETGRISEIRPLHDGYYVRYPQQGYRYIADVRLDRLTYR